MTNKLKPHSQEWFKILEKTNPAQAAQTRRMISLAGRDDVCSICGDEEAVGYELASEPTPSTMASTIMLCNDCLEIRNKMHNEKFIPLIS